MKSNLLSDATRTKPVKFSRFLGPYFEFRTRTKACSDERSWPAFSPSPN